MATLIERTTLARDVVFQHRCTLKFLEYAELVQGMTDTQIGTVLTNNDGVGVNVTAFRDLLATILSTPDNDSRRYRYALLVASDPDLPATPTDGDIDARVVAVLPDLVPASAITRP